MYEHFKNQFTSLLASEFSTEEMQKILVALDRTAYNYDVKKKETSLVLYNSEMPEMVETYLVCKAMEGLSEETLYNYGVTLKNFFFGIQKAPRTSKA